MVTPQRNDRTIQLRENARELADTEWPEEELTQPVININMPTPVEKPTVSDVEKGANAASTVLKAIPSTWPQIVGLICVSAIAGLVYYLTHK